MWKKSCKCWPARYFNQRLPFPQVSTVALDAKDEMDNVEDIVEILEQIGSFGKLALT